MRFFCGLDFYAFNHFIKGMSIIYWWFLRSRLEASRRDAEAQVVLARGSEESIRLITSAMGEEEMPVVYLLGEQYIKAMRDLAESDNSKMVVLPADILSTVKGMVGDKLKV